MYIYINFLKIIDEFITLFLFRLFIVYLSLERFDIYIYIKNFHLNF